MLITWNCLRILILISSTAQGFPSDPIGVNNNNSPGLLSLTDPPRSSEESANFSPEFLLRKSEDSEPKNNAFHFSLLQSVLSKNTENYLNNNESDRQSDSDNISEIENNINNNNNNKNGFGFENFENASMCPKRIDGFHPDFDASEVFQTLGFHDSWTRDKWFWGAKDFDFEGRYISDFHTVTPAPEVTVFVIPHSHSDPGWLKTFEGYFYSQTRHTLDLAVDKLMLYPNMTFIWNEISFLSKWWEYAKVDQKRTFLQLIQEGRLEILTGGWVMQDEATVNLYSMIDQLIEGRQWVKAKLGIVPNISWSIDPFGHGSTLPYVLKTANINHMVIQRLHYAWKKYFGETRFGNFEWVQRWDQNKEHGITTHNAPYDLYTTKHTCGPDPYVCLKFDFRNIYGEYSEYMRYARPVTDSNVQELSSALVEQFRKTASLQPHNIVMFPLGDDFRFDKEQEWDQQYEAYVKLINFINKNYHVYRTNIRFGTVTDYFTAIDKEKIKLPTFTGDFFPYSDVYVSGRPAYWTGYYGTRPYWKKFYRETESQIRSAEILFTYANNLVIQAGDRTLAKEYQNLVTARRNLALFAHHDGATGTSKRTTMDDYGRKLFEATRISLQIQRQAIKSIFLNALNVTLSSLGLDSHVQTFGDAPVKIPRVIYETPTIVKKILLFNSLGWAKTHLARVLVTSTNVTVFDPNGNPLLSQVNPVVEFTEEGDMKFRKVYELTFLAELKPVGLSVFEIRKSVEGDANTAQKPFVNCLSCKDGDETFFEIDKLQSPTIALGNGNVELLFDGESGLLRRMAKLQDDLSADVQLTFGGYKSIFRESGAYLLKPDTEFEIKIPFDDSPPKVLVVDGPVLSYISVNQPPLKVTTRILKTKDAFLKGAVFIDNVVDLGKTAAEVYMRFQTNLNSTTISAYGERQPTFFTDQNGFTIEKRVKVPSINYEGNNYPVNNMAYIQAANQKSRFSILVDRAHGFSSMETGRLETLIERRTTFDDGRGMSEGVVDNRRTVSNYVLLLEKLVDRIEPDDVKDFSNNLPTIGAHHLSLGLSYPPSLFGYDDSASGGYLGSYSLLTSDTHLINLRTISNLTLPLEEELPSSSALMIVHKLGHLPEFNYNDCATNSSNSLPFSAFDSTEKHQLFYNGTTFRDVTLDFFARSDLAGVIEEQNSFKTETNLSDFESGSFEITSILLRFSSVNRKLRL